MKRRPAARPPRAPPHGASVQQDSLHVVDAALARRAALLGAPDTTVGRLVHGPADGIAGLVIEKLGPVLVAQLFEGQWSLGEDVARALCAYVAERVGATAVYRKFYPRDRSAATRALERQHRDATPWIGAPAAPELAVREHGLTFLVRPYDGYLTGLFLDHRLNRLRVRELATGRRVLNTFAYTCGFTVAAALGGARETVSVDVSRRFLEWGKRNLTANGVPLDQQRFFCSDVFDYYRRAIRQKHRFDFVILDPPTFARVPGSQRTLVLAHDLERLVAGALPLLESGGILQLSVNHRGTSRRRLADAVAAAAHAQGRRCEWLAATPLPDDFCGDADYAKSLLVRLV
jgi:23S rRNA (cytosine1962-C5)-methyltransferase